MREAAEYAEVLVSLLAVSTPFAVAPVFLSLTAAYDASRRARSARLAALTVFVTLLVAIFAGEPLFRAFSISVPSFRVGGGLLILLTGMEMVRKGLADPDPESTDALKEVGAVPVGIPLLAGPGTIATMTIQSQEHNSLADNQILVLLALILSLVIWLCLRLAEPLAARLGRNGMDILTRVFGLILCALAVEFIVSGLLVLLPGLRGA